MKEKKPFQLKYRLLFLVMLCWVVPLVLVFIILGYDLEAKNARMLQDHYTVAVSNAAATTGLTLDDAVAASRDASYDLNVRSAYIEYLKTSDKVRLGERTVRYLNHKYRYDENFVSTVLFYSISPTDLCFTYNPNVRGSYENIKYYQENIHQQALDLSLDLDTKISFLENDGRMYMIRNIMDSNFRPYATIVMELNQPKVFAQMENLNWNKGIQVIVGDAVVSTPSFNRTPEESNMIAGLAKNGRAYVNSELDEIVLYGKEKTDNFSFTYIVEVEKESFLEQIFNYSGIIFLMLALLFILLSYVFVFSYQNIFIPINKLSDATKIIEEGKFGYQIENEIGNIEFSGLTDSVNHMSLKLKEQFEQIYNEELALRDAKIMALQSQINPHFLNNTLEIINWEARFAGNNKISSMIESLSLMLHAATDRNSLPLVTLKEELEYVEAYINIVTERFGDKLEVFKELADDAMEIEVPRLIMQPIIENAVEHGMRPDKICKVIIKTFKSGEELYIEIINNTPLSERDHQAIDELLTADKSDSKYATKMGIFNVNSRLKILYGDTAGLTIVSRQGYTVATITIPLNTGGLAEYEEN